MPARRLILPCAVIAITLIAVVGGVLLLTDGDGGRSEPARMEIPNVLVHEEGGLRYSYHVLSGTESLFDVDKDRKSLRNLVRERPEEARQMRARLEAKLGVENLDEFRKALRGDIEELEALGYL